MKKIFVTGGAGFIGSAFIRLVLDEISDVEIINYDDLTYAGNPANLIGLDEKRHTFIKGDIHKSKFYTDTQDFFDYDGNSRTSGSSVPHLTAIHVRWNTFATAGCHPVDKLHCCLLSLRAYCRAEQSECQETLHCNAAGYVWE